MVSSGIPLAQIKHYIVTPALSFLQEVAGPRNVYLSPSAVVLVTGTGLAESGYRAIVQDGGPALGFFQMEPATWKDMVGRYLSQQKPEIAMMLSKRWPGHNEATMVYDAIYAAILCRIRYMPGVGAIPAVTDAAGMAAYWKRIYNTAGGAGSVDASHVAMWQAAASA